MYYVLYPNFSKSLTTILTLTFILSTKLCTLITSLPSLFPKNLLSKNSGNLPVIQDINPLIGDDERGITVDTNFVYLKK